MGGGLFHTLGIGADSLFNSRQGVDTASHNISNAQIPGYSRQRLNLRPREPSIVGRVLMGNGASVTQIQRIHDQFTDDQINRANQTNGYYTSRHRALLAVETIYSPEINAGVDQELTNFFNAWQDLSNQPQELTVRTHVKEAAISLANSFNRTDSALRSEIANVNEEIVHLTQEVSGLLQSVGSLNRQIQESEVGLKSEANDLRDERDRALRKLSEIVDVNYYEDPNGMMTVRGPAQSLLVEGSQAAAFGVERGPPDHPERFRILVHDFERQNSREITKGLEGGKLTALVEVRDTTLPDLIEKNNMMAYRLANEMNEVHRGGYGIGEFSGTAGRNFFAEPMDVNSAAKDFAVSDLVANTVSAIGTGMTPDAPGDNIIANEVLRLKDKPMMAGDNTTLLDFYSNYVGGLGVETLRAEHVKEAGDVLLADLSARREAISGVSLDEEAVDLLRWQACFTASSKVITTVDEMIETVLGLKR